ncbi:hypothetical protein O6H91_16G079200 [Diphasiastrum complanatum]|uniref:Uncharacterized protein n=1 Tax=Diphasiastrum complanatum TaxID=34168 RepID=A0ACC2BE28_DIPCM|nr:hypothetical protein O6H91_16G079200 [Diphasiastrum complanatum]
MANAALIGNWTLCNSNGMFKSLGTIGIRGTRTLLPIFFLVTISASMTCLPNLRMINLVPLHNPLCDAIDRNNITIISIFSTNLCGGHPLGCRLFKYSIGWTLEPSHSTTLFNCY